MQEALNQKIDAFIAANKEQLLKDIAALVSINSVEGTPEEGAPFGAGPRAALDKTLELAAGMGFATRNCENYIGYAELAGKDPEKYLATICHVDVVPVGNGWTADPFTMRIQDGWLLGRGVADDKGPMVATLYALKFLKEQGYELRYPIRALAGTNEETHMQDVDYYLKNYPAPAFCFTPDAEFPVCNGENGLFGREEIEEITPAIEAAKAEGITGVVGPCPPDSVFSQALGGWYDIVVCMYHDQGHIPLKTVGFVYDREKQEWKAVEGVNVTLGLPIIRSSVDHGTDFYHAGKGNGNELSLVNAIKYAVKMTGREA